MNSESINLELNGNIREVKTTPAIYLLCYFIPLVGWLITLIIMITRKQFKGIFLNNLIIGAIGAFIIYPSSFLIVTFTSINSAGVLLRIITLLAIILLSILILFIFGLIIYSYIYQVINANKLTLKSLLNQGYHIMNEHTLTPEQVEFVEKSKMIKRPWFLVLDF